MIVKFGKVCSLNFTRTNADFKLEFGVIVLFKVHFSIFLIFSFFLIRKRTLSVTVDRNFTS